MDKRIPILFAVIIYVVCAIAFIYVAMTTDDSDSLTLVGYITSSTITVATLIAAVLILKTSPSEEYRERFSPSFLLVEHE